MKARRFEAIIPLMVWAIPLGLGLIVAYSSLHDYVVDGGVFVPAGRALLSGHWSRTFSNPEIQAGPLEVLLYGGSDLLGSSARIPYEALSSLFVNIGVAAATVGVVGSALRGRPFSRAAQSFAGTSVVALGLTRYAFDSGHPAEVMIPLMWVASIVALRRGHPIIAGTIIGLSGGWELWGILGAPIALLAADRRSSFQVAVCQALTTGLLFAPFVLAGGLRMFEYKWFVTAQSPLSLVMRVGTPVPWTYRVAQGAVALATGAIVARLSRASPHAIWEVPASVVAGRFLLEPVNFDYYWLAIWILAVVCVVEVATERLAALRRHVVTVKPGLDAPHA